MRSKQIIALVKTNMLYAYPQGNNQKQKINKKTGKPNAYNYKNIVWQNLLSIGVFVFLFGFMFNNLPLINYPGLFTSYVSMFVGMSVLQGFFIIYNLFYDSKDLAYYLPLPFKASEIYLAKLAVLIFMIFPYMIPIFILFIYQALSAQVSLVLGLLSSLFFIAIIIGVVFGLSVLLVHFITRLPIFQKHKQVITTILYGFSTFAIFIVVYLVTSQGTSDTVVSGEIFADYPVVTILQPFHTIFLEPANVDAWLGIIAWLGVLLVLLFVISKWVVPSFFQESDVRQPVRKNSERTKNIKMRESKDSNEAIPKLISINRTLIKYNFGLILDATLIMQMLSSKVLLPLVMVGPTIFTGLDLSSIPMQFAPIFFFGGIIYSIVTIDTMSVIGLIISLDRENFNYMKSLPFSMKEYMKQKFLFAYVAELLIPSILLATLALISNLSFIFVILVFLGLALGTLGLGHFYFVRDFRLLNLDWQNLTELFNRGAGTAMKVVIIFLTVGLGIAAIMLLAFAMMLLEPIWQFAMSAAIFIIPIAVIALLLMHYRKTFWSQFNN